MNLTERNKIIKNADQVVIKAGTRLLTDRSLISAIIRQIADLKKEGRKVILVSSGAVGLGMQIMNLTRRPSRLSEIQALAALGQSQLMSLYEKECAEHGFHGAQMLLTSEDLRDRERHLNVLNCIHSIWNQNNLPIINENDSVSIDEIKVGDNDSLAALLAVMTRSDLTLLLTTVDGLHTLDSNGKLDKRIPIVENITAEMKRSATGTDDSALSIGGMATKLAAAEMVTQAGEYMLIADGRDKDIITRIFKGEDTGTLFIPGNRKHMQSKKRWLSFFSKISGSITVDDGAKNALLNKGRSLLPSGILNISGNFRRGDTIEIKDSGGKIFAKGLTNFSSSDLTKIAGSHSSRIQEILGYGEDEIIHRNNLSGLKSE